MADSKSSRAARLLLVEDEVHVARLTELILTKAGYEVAVTHTAEAARDLLRSAANPRPDAVLLDVNLPGISGLDLLREIRADFSLSYLLVLMLSADELDPNQLPPTGPGVTVQCPKPIKPVRLMSLLLECGVGPQMMVARAAIA